MIAGTPVIIIVVREGWSCGQHQGSERHHRRKQHHLLHLLFSLSLSVRDPELGSGRASSRPPAPRPENSSLLFWVPSLGLLPYPILRGGRGGLRRAYSHSSSSSALGRERPCAKEKNGRDYPREKTSRVAPRAGAAQNSAWASHTR